MKPYYNDATATLHLGQALDVLRTLPDGSANCIVTSPPYFGLRDYGVDGQLGAEKSPAEFVANLTAIMTEARRVLADDGTMWLSLGDSYARQGGGGRGGGSTLQGRKHGRAQESPTNRHRKPGVTIAEKNLLGIPHRVVFALQGDGWIWRNTIIWAKPNGMPESVTDRLSTKHEYLFLLTKSSRYWFNLDPIREPHASEPGREGANCLRGQKAIRATGPNSGAYSEGGRNPGDVWTIPTQPFTEAHFATFPVEIPRRCIAAGCKPGGTVLDPFSGSGTTGLAAAELGRKYVGIDINRDYLDLSLRTRLKQPSLTSEANA